MMRWTDGGSGFRAAQDRKLNAKPSRTKRAGTIATAAAVVNKMLKPGTKTSFLFHDRVKQVTIALPMTALMTEPTTRIEPATLEDLPQLTELVMELMEIELDFSPNRAKQEHGLRLILEQPSRGRIFVLRTDEQIVGMVNLLFTISTAVGGHVILLEDLIVHPDHRGQGFGGRLLEYVKNFARSKGFLRITLLTDRVSDDSQAFFEKHGFQRSAMIPMRIVLDA